MVNTRSVGHKDTLAFYGLSWGLCNEWLLFFPHLQTNTEIIAWPAKPKQIRVGKDPQSNPGPALQSGSQDLTLGLCAQHESWEDRLYSAIIVIAKGGWVITDRNTPSLFSQHSPLHFALSHFRTRSPPPSAAAQGKCHFCPLSPLHDLITGTEDLP